ncbi:MAG: DNA polymerase III subunit gamma/tau [Clostridia bacterium]|nr:DNA polymerase III subunit gamma/tau [Clostridia bacterium]
MSYIALYRAFRPQTFSEIVGQDHVSKTLKNALKSNRVAHAYLFCGPRGTGKTSSAKILAKAVNCLEPVDGEPCNMCPNCQAVNEGNFLDVLEIDAASNRGIDEIRDIRDKVKFAPSQGKFKVYIIDEVHMLTAEAFNALLKTLEEPPAHVIFILATTEPQKIPLTVLSRCQRFDFRKISTKEIREHLEEITNKEKITISPSALNIITRKANGGMRDAISILDQCIAFSGNNIENEDVEKVLGTLGEEQILEISTAILEGDLNRTLTLVNHYLQSGKDIKEIVQDLIEHFRELLLIKISPASELISLSPEILEKKKLQAEKLSVAQLGQFVLKLTEIEKELRWSSQPQILVEAGLVELILAKHSVTKPAGAGVSEEPRETKRNLTQSVHKAPLKKSSGPTGETTGEKKTSSPPEKTKLTANISEIKKVWPNILEKVKQKRITTYAFLVEAQPVSLLDGELVLSFPQSHKFHRDKVQQLENKELLQAIIKEIAGLEVQIKCILEGEERKENNTPKDTGNSIIEQALELFGGDIVEIKD